MTGVLGLSMAGVGRKGFTQCNRDEVLEDLRHGHNECGDADTARAWLGRLVPQHDLRQPQRRGVAGIEPGEPPRGQGSAGEQYLHAVQPPIEVGQPGAQLPPQPGHSEHAPQGGADEPVLRDVRCVLVVAHFQRQRQPRAAGHLVGDPDPPAHQRKGLVDGHVSLQHPRTERTLHLARERLGQGGPQVGFGNSGDILGPEAGIGGVAEQEQQPRDAGLRLDLYV